MQKIPQSGHDDGLYTVRHAGGGVKPQHRMTNSIIFFFNDDSRLFFSIKISIPACEKMYFHTAASPFSLSIIAEHRRAD